MSFFDRLKKKPSASPELIGVVKALAKCQISILPDEVGTSGSLSSSRLGGDPYLPSDFVWPRFTDDDGVERPLSFFCQINLCELHKYDKDGVLPPRGILYFFYDCASFCWGFDPKDIGAARVYYYDNTDVIGMQSTPPPEDLEQEYTIPEVALTFRTDTSYPSFEELDIHTSLECDWEEYDQVLNALGVDTDSYLSEHKLLGYADVIQNEMLTECERVSRGLYCGNPEAYESTPEDVTQDISDHASDWILLLQLSTITKGDFELMLGDCGMIYYYIRKEDLTAMRFDKTMFSVQCG